MMDTLEDLVHEYEALQRWARGESPSFSMNIVGILTCGYGKLDPCGEWQFPLYPAEFYSAQLGAGTWDRLDNKSDSCYNTCMDTKE